MVKSDFQTKPRQILNAERLQHSNQISYKQAWRAKKKIQKSTFMDTAKSFQLILPFLEAITDSGLDSNTELDDEGNYATSRANAAISRDDDGTFEWCHVAPRACIHAFWHSRRFICVDGAHMKSDNNLVLLIITMLDSNEEILPLMWGFARNESKESWLDFLHGFREYFLDNLEMTEQERTNFEYLTIVSDRAKGLIPAISEVFPKAFHYYCTQHLAENVGNEYGKKVERVFRTACLVDTKAKFKACLDQIESLSAPARHYLDHIDREHYATSYAPLVDFPRFGQTCSNISESVNSAWMEARNLPILHSLHHLWTYMMSKFYERRYKLQKDIKYTNYAFAYFQKELEDSDQYLVTPQERENLVAIVYRANPGDRNTRLVQLKAQKCSCLAFQDHKIPCRHAIAVCRFFNIKPEDYIAKFYEISEYREQYKCSLLPVLLDDLEPDGFTKPPAIGTSRGRPVRKRMKRTTRETEARRRGNLVSSSSQRQQQDEARNRYQSGTTYCQGRRTGQALNPSNQIAPSQSLPAETTPDQIVLSQPPYAISNHEDNVPNLANQLPATQLPATQLPDPRDQDALWQRITAIHARLCETEAIGERYRAQIRDQIGAVREAVNGNRINNHSQSHTVQASTTDVEQLASRSQSPPGLPVSQANRGEQLSLDTDDPQRIGNSQNNPTASQVTYVDSTITNNNFAFGASSTIPNITINVTASPPVVNRRSAEGEAGGRDEGEGDEPPAMSTRSRKTARTDQL
jgi:hypothetical protein